jgi:hypothetical protein
MERGVSSGAGLELAASVARQAQAIAEGWVGSLMLFWVEGQPLRVILAGVVGTLALSGLALRIIEGRADAWISAAYLCIFLAWPFHEQMVRFLLPLMPILVLYAFEACARVAQRLARPPALAHLVLAVLLLTLTAPALAFIHLRAKAGAAQATITDWYRTPDLRQARLRAQVHLGLLADMEQIRTMTRAQDRVMWYVPGYLALLADRRGVAAPRASTPLEQYRERVRAAAPDYVFLSRFHPRDTVNDTAWQAGLRALTGRCKVVHTRTLPDGTTIDAMLLKCDPGEPRAG